MVVLTAWFARSIAGTLAAFVLLSAGIAWAAESPVFAIIDVQFILKESDAIEALTQSVERRRNAYQDELRDREAELRQVDTELSRQRLSLSGEAFAQKRRELEQQVAQLRREAQQQRRRLDEEFAAGVGKAQAALAEIAKNIAEERGLDLILSKATVVIVKPKFDLTQEALDRLNRRLPRLPASSED